MHRVLSRLRRRLAVALGCLVGLFVLMQLVPYGRRHTNPRVIVEPAWNSPRTRELAVRACFDCHSNETKWPWYADVAPFSWVIERDVIDARSVMNFSEWTHAHELATEAGPAVIRRDMPPLKYRLIHTDADLSEDDKIELARGLNATFGGTGRM
jgi:hypothetical protein